MDLVVLESPLKGDVPARVPSFLRKAVERILRERNRHYAFACMREELDIGRAPYASHVFFDQPGLLEDSNTRQRNVGIGVGLLWGSQAQTRTFYTDRGVSAGMLLAKSHAEQLGQKHRCKRLLAYRPLPLWRAAIAALLRWMLAKAYGARP